jgi:hypothetical protein
MTMGKMLVPNLAGGCGDGEPRNNQKYQKHQNGAWRQKARRGRPKAIEPGDAGSKSPQPVTVVT